MSLPERLRDKRAVVQLQRNAVSLPERLHDKGAAVQLQRNAVSPREQLRGMCAAVMQQHQTRSYGATEAPHSPLAEVLPTRARAEGPATACGTAAVGCKLRLTTWTPPCPSRRLRRRLHSPCLCLTGFAAIVSQWQNAIPRSVVAGVGGKLHF